MKKEYRDNCYSRLYGRLWKLFRQLLAQQGIETTVAVASAGGCGVKLLPASSWARDELVAVAQREELQSPARAAVE